MDGNLWLRSYLRLISGHTKFVHVWMIIYKPDHLYTQMKIMFCWIFRSIMRPRFSRWRILKALIFNEKIWDIGDIMLWLIKQSYSWLYVLFQKAQIYHFVSACWIIEFQLFFVLVRKRKENSCLLHREIENG